MRKLIVLAVVILMVSFAGCKKGGSSSSDTDSMKLMPSGLTLVGSINVQKALAIPAVAEQVTNMQKEEDYKLMAQTFGMTEKDVVSVVFGVDLAKATSGPAGANGIGLLTTSKAITDAVIEAGIESSKAEMEAEKVTVETKTVGGKKVYVFTVEGEDKPPVALSVISEKTIAAGTEALVAKAIDLAAGKGAAIKADAEIMGLCNNGSLNNLVWVASLIPAEVAAKAANPGSPVKADKIKNVLVTVDYDAAAGLAIAVNLTCVDDASAAEMKTGLDQMKGMAMMVGLKAEAIAVEQAAAAVNIKVTLDQEFLKMMQDKAKASAPAPVQ